VKVPHDLLIERADLKRLKLSVGSLDLPLVQLLVSRDGRSDEFAIQG